MAGLAGTAGTVRTVRMAGLAVLAGPGRRSGADAAEAVAPVQAPAELRKAPASRSGSASRRTRTIRNNRQPDTFL